jgi:hypothetical protein
MLNQLAFLTTALISYYVINCIEQKSHYFLKSVLNCTQFYFNVFIVLYGAG